MERLHSIFVPFALCLALLWLSGCAGGLSQRSTPKTVGYYKVGTSYKIKGKRYHPKETFRHTETGTASWYGPNFHGKLTANGETYDQYAMTAAHRTLQMPSIIKVTNLENNRSAIMRVNDRGPFAKGRVLDVSKKGAEVLGFKNQGLAKVRIELLETESRQVAAMAKQGKDTDGFEIAVARQINERRRASKRAQTALASSSATMQPVRAAYAPVPANLDRPVMPATPPPSVHAHVMHKPQTLFVQTGTFTHQNSAVTYARKIRGMMQREVHILRKPQRTGLTLYNVRIPVNTVDEAGQMQQQLQIAGISETVIVME